MSAPSSPSSLTLPYPSVFCSGLFIISPTGVLRQITINDLPVGRSVDETLRLIKAFQFVDEHGGASRVFVSASGSLSSRACSLQ